MTRSKEQAKSAYNSLGRWYDVLAGGSEQKIQAIGLEMLHATEGEILLEIGFGTGRGILSLAQSVGDTGKVYGIDLSEKMLAIAQRKVRRMGLAGRVELKCGDAVRLPFEEEFLDAVYTSFTLELFDTPEIPVLLGECRRVLRSGGRICVISMVKKISPNIIARLYEGTHRWMPAVVDCRPIFVRQEMEDAGLRILDATEMSMWGLPVEIVLAEK